MGKIVKILNDYKNALYVFIACIAVTMSGFVFNKGEFYNYNYERQVVQDCAMGWYEATDKICEGFKDKQRKMDDEDLMNVGKINIPAKSPFDYVIFLSNILQVVFVGISAFILGASTKDTKLSKLWKFLDVFLGLVVLTAILNFESVIITGVFSSNDFLRFLFEIGISIIVIILGRKL